MFCPKCGNEIIKNQKFCCKCGHNLTAKDNVSIKNFIKILMEYHEYFLLFIGLLLIVILVIIFLAYPSEEPDEDTQKREIIQAYENLSYDKGEMAKFFRDSNTYCEEHFYDLTEDGFPLPFESIQQE